MNRDTGWFKSTHSAGASDACLEARMTPGTIRVRDSVNPTGPLLTFDNTAWRALIEAVRRDQL